VRRVTQSYGSLEDIGRQPGYRKRWSLKPYYSDNVSEAFHIEDLASLRLRSAATTQGCCSHNMADGLVSLHIHSPTIGPRSPLVWNTLKQSLALDPSDKLGLRKLGGSDNWR
jgi:hypothetical protein